jgi:hypothetical protein
MILVTKREKIEVTVKDEDDDWDDDKELGDQN